MKYFFCLVMAASFLMGCSSENTPAALKAIPPAFGKLNDIVIVADQPLWDGPVGDSIRYYYSSAYPLLPQPEPLFDLRHFTPEDLSTERMRKELRTYMIVADLNDANSPTAKLVRKDLGDEKIEAAKADASANSVVGLDKWAKGQMLIYQYAFGEEQLIQMLIQNFPAVEKRVHEFDKPLLEAYVYLNGDNAEINRTLQEDWKIRMRIPREYKIAVNNDEIIWVRNILDESSSNIILKKIPYTAQSQLTKENIIAIRDSIGRQYISSTTANTYMLTNTVDLPVISSATRINGYYAVDARGIWEIANDYMGGAFVSYLILNPNTNELIFVDGFLHAPGQDKRNFMQYIDHIIHTMRF
ncbi:MAG TPA: DUF4837 family protein [Saprospiraceae bacterium]|nr:DUF4837 family protein [Saprospiraceae bacterium]HMQ84756.1 DUF4837 family protein [Saprospiraceae bacterium]